MKRCPQCNSVFDDSLVYCTNDGAVLVEETFVLPSEMSQPDDEEITIVHHPPVNVTIPNQNAPAPTEQFNYQTAPPAETVVPVIIDKRRNTGKYVLFLVLGLVLGGSLVLAAVLLSMYLFQTRTTQISVNQNKPANSAPNVKETPTATAPPTPNSKHEKPTDAPDDDFNGRVIAQNAYVRSSPSKTAKQIDVLPVGDRLEIEERENENSPWYRVTCEHGTAGWMHGNTIEFAR